MMSPFDWLRSRVRQAFIDGCADGCEAIDRGEVARLQERLTLALAAPVALSPAAASDTAERADQARDEAAAERGAAEHDARQQAARGGKRGAK